jgi:site-specific recombinase XerD
LKSFWNAMSIWDPSHRERYDLLSSIPFKRCPRNSPDYLEPDELKRLFEGVDVQTRQGFRDFTLLRYLYNTGSRVSEVAEARIHWLSLGPSPEVTIRGKGGKSRVCPLWTTTAEMLRIYLRRERLRPRPGYEDYLFITRRGSAFRRQSLWKLICGYFARAAATLPTLRQKRLTPHGLRHTTAVHLLRAGVEMNVIKAWLGHADVSTTSLYIDLDLDKKREALERFRDIDIPRMLGGETKANPLPADVLAWLERL